MKGIDTLMAAVFIILISVIGIAIVLETSQPSVGRLQEISLFQEAQKILTNVDNAVRAVSQEGEGSTRVLQVSVSGGSYVIDTNREAIIFSMDSISQIIGVGVSKTEGNINMFGELNRVFLNVSYSNVNVTGGGIFGKGYHNLIIRNNGYDFVNQKQIISISIAAPLLPPTAFITNQYNQTETVVLSGTSFSPTSNLDDLGINTFDIYESLGGSGIFFYPQSSTINITGDNTTSADYTNYLDNQNYNITALKIEYKQHNQYNQSETAIVTGNWWAGDTSNLNVLGDDQFYDVQGDVVSSSLQSVAVFFDDFEIDNYATVWTETPSANVWERGNQRSYGGGSYAGEWEGGQRDRSIELINALDLSDAVSATAEAYIYIENGFDRGEYVCMDYSCNGGSTWNSNSGGGGSLCIDGNSDPENRWNLVSLDIGSVCSSLPSNFKIRFRAYSSSGAEDADVDYVNITKVMQVPMYSVEVWHNSSIISYTGSLNSINVSINFTTTQTKDYFLQIYNWVSSSWDSTSCDLGLVTANSWNMWWCNETSNPTDYISFDGIARIRISSVADETQAILREDYVQYFISSALPDQYDVLVEHNSSTISQATSSISNINVTTVLKNNVSGTSVSLYIYNLSENDWYLCQQDSNVGTSYSILQCIINDNPADFISQETDGIIRVRINSSNSISYQLMEDYLVYKIETISVYRTEVEHNTTDVSFSGNLNSINISVNFTSNVTLMFGLKVYNFNLQRWEDIPCDGGQVVANSWNTWWCNITNDPNYYLSEFFSGKIRIKLFNYAHNNLALVKEDYVQYYVTYTS
jgi:hypothetical protein